MRELWDSALFLLSEVGPGHVRKAIRWGIHTAMVGLLDSCWPQQSLAKLHGGGESINSLKMNPTGHITHLAEKNEGKF